MGSNVGRRLLTMVMVIETGVAQLPAEGVNVYVTVPRADVLMLVGFHVPVTPSFDTSGRTVTPVFWQYEFATVGKVGVTLAAIVMIKETGVEQLPAVGVNVYVVVP